MPIGKQGAHFGQPVNVGGLGLGVSAEATDPIIQIVDREEQDVRLGLGRQRKNRQKEKETIQFQYIFHDSAKGNVQSFTFLSFFIPFVPRFLGGAWFLRPVERQRFIWSINLA